MLRGPAPHTGARAERSLAGKGGAEFAEQLVGQ
ncbi:hypothetical protein FB384_003378 [Prauserella sediminis]|uniref:Uncharacterized protein n=1 Tax=Prauserella sediminis TaxID=577680 RepID=A0A839XSQ8_9PSEU|nr:hypothetical protein [Prauserella sediminis]